MDFRWFSLILDSDPDPRAVWREGNVGGWWAQFNENEVVCREGDMGGWWASFFVTASRIVGDNNNRPTDITLNTHPHYLH